MHWFWRGTIAIGVTCVLGAPFAQHVDDIRLLALRYRWFIGQRPMILALGFLAPAICAMVVYGILTRYWGPDIPFDGETRCRRCKHILRGISEPRCPECGERI